MYIHTYTHTYTYQNKIKEKCLNTKYSNASDEIEHAYIL